ncbi:MAG: metal ABC transporter permease [Aquificae bacterium]|nr:metal ABC transporter permease [Aquificota bacterium]
MAELLEIPFVQNALIGGVILAVLLSVLSLFIYLKNWSFINVGISHAAFGGLAVGFYLGLSPTVFGIIFAVATGLLIGYISRKGDIHEDISIGILFSMSMAFGVIVITLSPNYNTDLFTFLFGNILTISKGDIILLGGFSVFALGFIAAFFNKIMYCCYNEEVAYVSGINTPFYYYSLITIIAIATVLSVKLVGVILASAMMILPAAMANQIFWHYRKILVFSVFFSILMVVAGIFISFQYDLPSGATIVLLYSALFSISVLTKKLIGKAG